MDPRVDLGMYPGEDTSVWSEFSGPILPLAVMVTASNIDDGTMLEALGDDLRRCLAPQVGGGAGRAPSTPSNPTIPATAGRLCGDVGSGAKSPGQDRLATLRARGSSLGDSAAVSYAVEVLRGLVGPT